MTSFAWVGPLALVYVQTLALAALFVLSGSALLRWGVMPSTGPAGGMAARWGRAYFLGLPLFLLLFVAASRLAGTARRGMVLALAALVALAVAGQLRRGAGVASRRVLATLLACTGLLLLFSMTNLTCWLTWLEGRALPSAWTHFGSIHAGRYANYAIYIAAEDRIPYLAQNLGQSMLAGVNLLLGAGSSLAALMAWIPVSLTALALLVFGTFRERGLSRASSCGGAFFVLSCNVALAWNHVLVLDNGSPLGMIGYSDLIVATGSFLVFCAWLEPWSGASSPRGRTAWSVPLVLGCTWSWLAPQNIVMAPGAALVCWLTRARAPGRPAWIAAAAFLASALAGATQLGPFLPRALQEDVGTMTVLPEKGPALHPYMLYVTSHWSEPSLHWNVTVAEGRDAGSDPMVYEDLYARTIPAGRPAFARAVLALIGTHLIASLHVYFFPWLGLALMALAVRRAGRRGDPAAALWRLRLWIALATFGLGFAISFGFEYGGLKWWLTRFLAPGIVVCLIGLYETVARELQDRIAVRRVALASLLIVASYGPLRELAWTFRQNFFVARSSSPLDERLNVLVSARGPFPE